MFDPRRLAFAQPQLPVMAQEREQMLGLLAPLFRAQQGAGLLGQPWPAQEGAAPQPQAGGLLAPAMPADVPAPGAMPTAGNVTPAAPPMAGLPRDHEAQLAQAAAGAAPAVTQQPSGWERFGQALGDNSDLLIGLGSGIMSAPTWSEGAARGLQQGQRAQLLGDQGRLQRAKLQQQQGSLSANAKLIQKAYPQISDQEAIGLAGNTAAVSEALKRLSPSEQYRQHTDDAGNVWSENSFTGQRQLLKGTDATADQRNYEAAKAGGFAGTFMDYQKASKSPLVNIDQTGEKAEVKGRMEGLSKRFNDIAEDGSAAELDLRTIQHVTSLLKNVDPGAKTALFEELRKNTGIALDPNASNVQGASAALEYLVPRQRIAGSGTSSDRDMSSYRAALPALMGTPGGNEIAAQTIGGLAQHRLDRARIVQQWQLGDLSAKDAQAKMDGLRDPFETFKTWQGQQGKQGSGAAPSGGKRMKFNPATGALE